MSLILPDLPYDYSALEPYIDAGTMEIHHSKHHKAYVDKANTALQGTGWEEKPIEEIIASLDSIPEDKRAAVRNNGGGVLNHNIFWTVMSPKGGGEPQGELKSAIDEAFGGFASFKEKFSGVAAAVFGSGWVWLARNGDMLEITPTPNQDNLISGVPGLRLILCLDVWEHAYYIKYQNRRPEYIEAWWNVVNWEEAGKRFLV